MDLIDKRLLCELDMDCRTTTVMLARKLRVGRNVIAYRMKRLEREGAIRGYICTINLGLLGYRTFKIFFKLNGSSHEEFEKDLVANKSVIHVLKTEGAFDYSISIAVRSVLSLDEFIMGLKNKYRDLIRDYHVSIIVYSQIFKLNKQLLNQKSLVPKREKYSGEAEPQNIDEKDKKILRELAQAARLPVVDIAKNAGLSVDTVMYRLKTLERKFINSNRVLLNLNKLGFYHYVIMLRIKQATKEDESRLVNWCANTRQVMYCSKRIGYFDFEVNAGIKDIGELTDFLKELRAKFQTVIDSYEIVLNSELLKLNYIPF